MPSWQARMASRIVRRRIRRALGDLSDMQRVRRVFAHPLPAPRSATYTPATVGGIAGEWVAAKGAEPRATLLYIHGGGFVGCSPLTHRPVTAAYARQAQPR